MKFRTTVLVTGVLVSGLGLGAAFAPVAETQSRTHAEPARIVQMLTAGSQIGVSIRDVDEEAARQARLETPSGVVVEEVQEGSPAEKAGFREGDLVVEFDGERVRSTRQFTRLVQETPAGREVQVVVMRDGNRTALSVAPRASEGRGFRFFHDDDGPRILFPPAQPAPPAPPAPPRPPAFEFFPQIERFFGSSGRLGITVDSLSDQLATYFGVDEGVLVTAVSSGSVAEKAGVRAGDVIVSIDGAAVASTSDLSRRVSRLEDGDEFTLEVVRNKQKLTLTGKVEAPPARRWTARTVI